ncbi:YqeG family HAD IIIA-type phosphatase [Gorillibacterium massiliense]|uniref:YqeG family HAD IIIA-type phosphatase n=1 Tax=Gorillibacterium massiliense TaxID=1280390 RepID=UPI0004AE4DD3|nr:YqeG family HAD IIIA-type phosphatase [Gorillibacterium massiliense]
MLQKFVPRQQVATIYEIVLAELWDKGIRGIITDLDNTLVGAKEPLATPELVEWLKHVQAAGFKVVIVSNNKEARVSRFASPLGIPFLFAARKPSNLAFRRALQVIGLDAEQTAVLGDQMMTDVLGGNRMGLHTILVQPISPADEGFFTRINRRLEKIVIRWMKKQSSK